eukprot:3102749-Pyramimonas_sp.AAC.1
MAPTTFPRLSTRTRDCPGGLRASPRLPAGRQQDILKGLHEHPEEGPPDSQYLHCAPVAQRFPRPLRR